MDRCDRRLHGHAGHVMNALALADAMNKQGLTRA
jgi:hypothetical protein